MKQSVRALGWTVTIATVLLFLFIGTAAYSVFQTFFAGQGLQLGNFEMNLSGNEVVMAIPFTINNTGYYDINDFEVATRLKDINGSVIVQNITNTGDIERGTTQSRRHILVVNFQDLLSKFPYILFNDTEFSLDFLVGFKYAYAFDFQVSITHMPIRWGAPLYGLKLYSVSPPSFNGTHILLLVALEVENHSFFDINGSMSIGVYNEDEELIGSSIEVVELPSGSRISGTFEVDVWIQEPQKFTGKGFVTCSLELPGVGQTFEIWRQEYG